MILVYLFFFGCTFLNLGLGTLFISLKKQTNIVLYTIVCKVQYSNPMPNYCTDFLQVYTNLKDANALHLTLKNRNYRIVFAKVWTPH